MDDQNMGYVVPPGPAVYPQAVTLIVLSGLTLLLDIPPMIWHFKGKNVAACSLIAWLIVTNFFNFLNAIIWPNDDITRQWKGYGLCDVESKLQIGASVALVGSLVSIMRNLCQVMDTRKMTLVPSKKQKRIDTAFTTVLCFAFPIYSMAIHFVVQNVRYYLFTISGCVAGVDNSWLAVVLLEMWPPILSLAAVWYSILLSIRIHRYKSDFSQLMAMSQTTKSRFLRLFVMCGVLILVLMPVQFYVFIKNIEFGVRHFDYAETHGPLWGYIEIIPSFGVVLFNRWINVAAGFLVFVFFGIGDDAIRMYKGWLVRAGLDKIWPSLARGSGWTGWSFAMGTWGSLNERARQLLFKKRDKEGSEISLSNAIPRDSTSTYDPSQSTASPKPVSALTYSGEKGFGDVHVTRDIYHGMDKDLEK